MRMRDTEIEEQVQQILIYIQGGLTDILKENILEDLEAKKLEFTSIEDFLTELKIKEFVQEFRRIVRKSRYKK